MNDYEGMDERIVKNVKAYAKKLHIVNHNLDLEDIEQELMLHVIKGMRNFDPNLGDYEHFLRRILVFTGRGIQKSNSRKLRFYRLNADADALESANFANLVEARDVIRSFPHRYRLIYVSLKQHSVMEIAKMLHLSKASVYRDLQFILTFFHLRNHSPEEAEFLFRRRLIMKNLSVIETMEVKELSRLEVYDLADLHEQLSKLINHTKELKEKFEDALELRFSETIKNNLRSENRDTGTTKF